MGTQGEGKRAIFAFLRVRWSCAIVRVRPAALSSFLPPLPHKRTMQSSPGGGAVLEALHAFVREGSAYKETLLSKLRLDDERAAEEKAAVAAHAAGLYAIFKGLETVCVLLFSFLCAARKQRKREGFATLDPPSRPPLLLPLPRPPPTPRPRAGGTRQGVLVVEP